MNLVRLWESRNMNVHMYMCAHVYSVYLRPRLSHRSSHIFAKVAAAQSMQYGLHPPRQAIAPG